MPTNKPVPPPGYSIVKLPSFLKTANAGTKTVRAESEVDPSGQVIADVHQSDPSTIEVREPRDFNQPVQTHESTHVYQFSRNQPFVDRAFNSPKAHATKEGYDYGGIKGLEQALRNHKTIADFNTEQQADMVADYQRLTQDAIRKGDKVALARITAAYHPFVNQLAKIPPSGANMGQMTKQDLNPDAPPVPPSTVAGMPMLPDKLVGGEVGPAKRYTAKELNNQAKQLNPSANGHKIGETKKFANGKTGVWDGHGWESK